MRLQNTPALETQQLILRKFCKSDVAAMLDIFGDKAVNTYLPWYPVQSLRQAEEFYEENYAKAYELPAAYKYAVCLKTDNVPIGYVNVSLDDSHDFGYGLRKEFWHKSITTNACRAVLQQLENDGLDFITATHDIKNPHSGEVMKKLGMAYCYTYQEQWQPKNILVDFRMYQLNFNGKTCPVYMKYWDKYEKHWIENN